MYWHVYDFLGKDNVFFKNHQGNVIHNYVYDPHFPADRENLFTFCSLFAK